MRLTAFLEVVAILGLVFLTACSVRVLRHEEGGPVPEVPAEFETGRTDLTEALDLLGAPDRVLEMRGQDVLVYVQRFSDQREFTLGVPLQVFYASLFRFSGSGSLDKADLLVLFFDRNRLLTRVVYETNTKAPFLGTLFSDSEPKPGP